MNTQYFKAIVTPVLRQNDEGLSKDAKAIALAIVLFPLIFDKMNPKTEDALIVIDDFYKSITKAVNGSTLDKETRKKLRKAVELIIRTWAPQVTLAAGGDAEIIAMSKFPVSKAHTIVTSLDTPDTPGIEDGTDSGSVKGKAKSVKSATAYEWRSSTKDPATATDDDYTYYTTGGITVLMTGLTPGVNYFFSYRAVAARCKSSWSNAKMYMVR